MDPFGIALNDLLVNTFQSILKLEEETLKSINGNELSISEMHMLEAIVQGEEEGSTITDIAQNQSITLPTVTVAINKLQRKGYVCKTKGGKDARQVRVHLTDTGKRAEAAHRYFHRRMVQAISKNISENERDVLLKGLTNLKSFFTQQEEIARLKMESANSQGDEMI